MGATGSVTPGAVGVSSGAHALSAAASSVTAVRTDGWVGNDRMGPPDRWMRLPRRPGDGASVGAFGLRRDLIFGDQRFQSITSKRHLAVTPRANRAST